MMDVNFHTLLRRQSVSFNGLGFADRVLIYYPERQSSTGISILLRLHAHPNIARRCGYGQRLPNPTGQSASNIFAEVISFDFASRVSSPFYPTGSMYSQYQGTIARAAKRHVCMVWRFLPNPRHLCPEPPIPGWISTPSVFENCYHNVPCRLLHHMADTLSRQRNRWKSTETI